MPSTDQSMLSIRFLEGQTPEEKADILNRYQVFAEDMQLLRARQRALTTAHSVKLADIHALFHASTNVCQATKILKELRTQTVSSVKEKDAGKKNIFSLQVIQAAQMLKTGIQAMLQTTDNLLQTDLPLDSAFAVNKIDNLLRMSTAGVKTTVQLTHGAFLDCIEDVFHKENGINTLLHTLRSKIYGRYDLYHGTRQSRFDHYSEELVAENEAAFEGITLDPIMRKVVLCQLQIAEKHLLDQHKDQYHVTEYEMIRKYLDRDIFEHLYHRDSALSKPTKQDLIEKVFDPASYVAVEFLVKARSIEDTEQAREEMRQNIMHHAKLLSGLHDDFPDEAILPNESLPESLQKQPPPQVLDALMSVFFGSQAQADGHTAVHFPERVAGEVIVELPVHREPEAVEQKQVVKEDIEEAEEQEEKVDNKEKDLEKEIPEPIVTVEEDTAEITTPLEIVQDEEKEVVVQEEAPVSVISEEAIVIEAVPTVVAPKHTISVQTLSLLTNLPEEVFVAIDTDDLTDDVVLDRIGAVEATIGLEFGRPLIMDTPIILADPMVLQVTIDRAQPRVEQFQSMENYDRLGWAILSSYPEVLQIEDHEFKNYMTLLQRVWSIYDTGNFSEDTKNKYSPWARPDSWSSVDALNELRTELINIRDGKPAEEQKTEDVSYESRDKKFVAQLMKDHGYSESMAKNMVAILVYAYRGYKRLPDGALYDRSPARLRDQSTFHKTCEELCKMNALSKPPSARAELYILNGKRTGIESAVLNDLIGVYLDLKRAG